MIIPCIDLMDGKVVQLVQGREKVLEGGGADEMLRRFAGFPQIQVIDLDAAMEKGSNAAMVEYLASRATVRVGGGVRTVERARELVGCGAYRIIVGTAALSERVHAGFLNELKAAIGAARVTIALDSRGGQVVVRGWRESTRWTARDILPELEPYCSGFLCTYVDKEGMLQGTDLGWFESLRKATSHELIAAGGITTIDEVKALHSMRVHCAIGMAIYTGRLHLDELRSLNTEEECR